MKTFKWSIPEPNHHEDSRGAFDPKENREIRKELASGFAIMALAYATLFPLAELALDESLIRFIFCSIIVGAGFLTTTLAGKNGIKGSLVVSLVGAFLLVVKSAATDPLWIIGLLFLGFYHVPILIGWGLGYGLYKKRMRKIMETEPIEIANT